MEPGKPDYIVNDEIAGGSTEPALANEARHVTAGGSEPNLSSPVACSGKFIQWYQQGKLPQMSRRMFELRKAVIAEQRISHELANINDPCWLMKFAKKTSGDFAKSLTELAAKLEAERFFAREHIANLAAPLEAEFPGLVAYMARSNKERAHIRKASLRKHVQERNRVILRYRDRPAWAICRELDDAFPTVDNCPAPQFPLSWYRGCGVTTFVQAYSNPGCRPRVETLISRVKHGLQIR